MWCNFYCYAGCYHVAMSEWWYREIIVVGYNRACFQKQDLEPFSGGCNISRLVNTSSCMLKLACEYIQTAVDTCSACELGSHVLGKLLLQNKTFLLLKGAEGNRLPTLTRSDLSFYWVNHLDGYFNASSIFSCTFLTGKVQIESVI